MASDESGEPAVLNERFWQQILTSFTPDEVQALRDWAGEIERLKNQERVRSHASRLLERIGWYTRP